LEFLLFGSIPSLEQAQRIVCGAGTANGGLIIDLWQLHQTEVTLGQLQSVPERLIKSLQISDVREDSFENIREESRSGRCLAGRGRADIHGYLSVIRASGACPFYEVEVLSDDLRSKDPKQAACDMVETSSGALANAGIIAGWPNGRIE
jgi:sugar phosphate isomerase/epimerase